MDYSIGTHAPEEQQKTWQSHSPRSHEPSPPTGRRSVRMQQPASRDPLASSPHLGTYVHEEASEESKPEYRHLSRLQQHPTQHLQHREECPTLLQLPPPP